MGLVTILPAVGYQISISAAREHNSAPRKPLPLIWISDAGQLRQNKVKYMTRGKHISFTQTDDVSLFISCLQQVQ